MHNRNSFTLIELLAVIVILMLLLVSVVYSSAQTTKNEATQKKISELIAQLGDENDSIRRDAAWNLGRIADSEKQSNIKEAIQPLLRAIVDTSPYVRTYAAYALGRIGDSQATQPLINALKDSHPNVRLFVSDALGRIGDQQAEEALNKVLKDEDERVRDSAAKALKQIKSKVVTQGGVNKEATKEGLSRELEKKSTISGTSTYTQKRIEGFIKQLGDPDARISNSAVQHLKAIGESVKIPLLKALERSSPNPPNSLVEILGDIGDVPAIKPLYKVLNEGNSDISKSASLALGKIRTRITSEEWDKEVKEYREHRISRMRESYRLERQNTVRRPVAVRPSQRSSPRYPIPVNALSNVFGWIYINVDIEIQDNGDLLVSEEQKYSFPSQHSNERYRWLPTDKLDEVKDVEVFEVARNDKAFSEPQRLSPKIGKKRGQFWIRWSHELNPPETRTFLLKYRVIGGFHVDKSKNELCWRAVAQNKTARVGTSRVRVHLPPPLWGKTRAMLGYGTRASIDKFPDGSTIEFNSIGSIPRQSGLEVRISFPQDILSIKKSKWQGLWARTWSRNPIRSSGRQRSRRRNKMPDFLIFFLPFIGFMFVMRLITGEWGGGGGGGGGCGGGGCGGGCGGGGCGGGG